MEPLHFKKTVSSNGSVTLTNLPPNSEVEITITDKPAWQTAFEELQKSFCENNPLAQMSKEDILQTLKKTREAIPNGR